MSATPILTRDGDVWTPAPEAKGPFPGQHGGVVAGAMAAAMECLAVERGAGQPLSLHVHFLRPVLVAPVEVGAAIVREGRRVQILEAELRAEGKVSAMGRAVFGRERNISGLASPQVAPTEPAACPEAPFRPSIIKGVWLGDACEFRGSRDAITWVRLTCPLTLPPTPLAYVACLADCSSGTSKPDGFETPVVGDFPNADLSVHMAHLSDLPADAAWVGLEGSPRWHANGLGYTATKLHDHLGPFGQATQALLLNPVKEDS